MSTKRKINTALCKISAQYWESIPFGLIRVNLSEHGIVPLQEDQSEFSGMFIGESSDTVLDIAPITSKVDSWYSPYSNAMLVLGWHKMQSGRYEINTYIS
jgi:hypothetical protein